MFSPAYKKNKKVREKDSRTHGTVGFLKHMVNLMDEQRICKRAPELMRETP